MIGITDRSYRVVSVLVLAAFFSLAGCGEEEGDQSPGMAGGAKDVATQPSSPWGYDEPLLAAVNRGVALMEQYEKDGEAVTAFEQAVELAPDVPMVQINLAIALFNRHAEDDLARAEAILSKVLESHPDNPRALFLLGALKSYNAETEAALPLFEKAVQVAPDDAFAWYFLGRCKDNLGEPCVDEMKRAIELEPFLASAYHKLHAASRRARDIKQAEHWQKLHEEVRNTPLARNVSPTNYQEMGPLGLALPLPAQLEAMLVSGELSAASGEVIWSTDQGVLFEQVRRDEAAGLLAGFGAGMSRADVNNDGLIDIMTTAGVRDGRRCLTLLLAQPDGAFADRSEDAGLASVTNVVSCAVGDIENDGDEDLFVCRDGANVFFLNNGQGVFTDVTAKAGITGSDELTLSAVFLDADHDADLDLYVCNAGVNRLLNNIGDGIFKDITQTAGVGCGDKRSIMLAPADLDGDRDTDLVVMHTDAPAQLFYNDRMGRYHEGSLPPVTAARGGIVQDFNGDLKPDLLVSPGASAQAVLLLSQSRQPFERSTSFDKVAKALASYGPFHSTYTADIDLDGDLDIIACAKAGHVLRNDGRGHFVLTPDIWPLPALETVVGISCVEMTGDGIADLVIQTTDNGGQIQVVPIVLNPPANWLAISPSGVRDNDKQARSPESGYGVSVRVQSGRHGQMQVYTGLNGGLNQSRVPVVFGLDGARRADYIFMTWPDGVTQAEIQLAANMRHDVPELQRKESSCPVLFTWDGTRFTFVTDFAGVGGLGYFIAPDEYAQPQVLEHVKIEPGQLVPRDGRYELRICEPMEETAYVDRLELIAIDHPAGTQVFPDERSGGELSATHRLLAFDERIFPARAIDPAGHDCTDNLSKIDRVYAYQPKRDRRFLGFCEPHHVIVDFATNRLAQIENGRSTFLVVNGWIEYPYSQNNYAASQAGVTWEPLVVEQQMSDGQWQTIFADAGGPGGMGRTFTIDLTGKLRPGSGRLRLSTRMEIYFDQMFIATDVGLERVRTQSVPLVTANLHRLGFPIEYSPDGRQPLLYTYDIVEASSSFKTLCGQYTRYGRVDGLLTEFDDQYVIFGSGDEIALSFDADAVEPLTSGHRRSFVLVSHAYCKDMDLYTASGETVAPLPFKAMSVYPYDETEDYPSDGEHRRYRATFNTRRVE